VMACAYLAVGFSSGARTIQRLLFGKPLRNCKHLIEHQRVDHGSSFRSHCATCAPIPGPIFSDWLQGGKIYWLAIHSKFMASQSGPYFTS
jgi:hypothetical protein